MYDSESRIDVIVPPFQRRDYCDVSSVPPPYSLSV